MSYAHPALQELERERVLDIRVGRICLRYDSKKMGWRDFGGKVIKCRDKAKLRAQEVADMLS